MATQLSPNCDELRGGAAFQYLGLGAFAQGEMQMRSTTVVVALAIALAAPAAAADVTVGANLGSARANGGDFDGSDTGWKLHLGSGFNPFVGGEIGYINFGNLGGNGPEARAWTPAVTVGVPLGQARLYGKGGVSFADV